MSNQQILDTYLEHHEPGWAKSTYRDAAASCHEFAKWLERNDLRVDHSLSVATLQDYRAHIARRRLKNSTKSLKLVRVKHFLNFARARGEIRLSTDDIREALPGFKIETRLPKVLTFDEIKRLLNACIADGSETARFVLAALLTGMRRMEIRGLRAKHIDDAQITVFSPKTRHERIIPLELLGVGADFFVQTPEGYQWDYQRHKWDEIRNAAGLEGTPFKTLRATWSSYAKSSGETPWVVEQILGHSKKTAGRFYDRLVAGVTGETVPEWLGCPDLVSRAVEMLRRWRD